MSMILYGCGFNAHGQLTNSSIDDHPQDIFRLQRLQCAHSIRILYVGWADTLCPIVEIDGVLHLQGVSCINGASGIVKCEDVPSSRIVSTFGDHAGLRGVLTDLGQVLVLRSRDSDNISIDGEGGVELCICEDLPALTLAQEYGGHLSHLVVAGNGKVCASFDDYILQFDSWESFIKEPQASTRHMLPASPIQLVAGENSFTALLSDSMMGRGLVYTWGDARHHHLGRRVDNELSSARIPTLVDHLGGIPVRKIASGGWITAAVSIFDDLYLWGGRPGEEQRITALPALLRSSADDDDDHHHGLVNLVNITNPDDDDNASTKESLNIVDVAVGQGHVVALSDDHRLWAIGRGHNGQLGRPLDGPLFFAPEWIPMELPYYYSLFSSRARSLDEVDNGQTIQAVVAGPASTLILFQISGSSSSPF